jgi:hypothetical protein
MTITIAWAICRLEFLPDAPTEVPNEKLLREPSPSSVSTTDLVFDQGSTIHPFS